MVKLCPPLRPSSLLGIQERIIGRHTGFARLRLGAVVSLENLSFGFSPRARMVLIRRLQAIAEYAPALDMGKLWQPHSLFVPLGTRLKLWQVHMPFAIVTGNPLLLSGLLGLTMH